MDFRKLADLAKAELEPLSAGLDLRAALLAAETAELGPGMLGALLAHELVAGHAAMMKLTAKLDRWLALMSDDRLPANQDRGARESVRLAVAAARLTERYRLGLQSLARLKGWDGAAAKRRRPPAADPFADAADDDPPDGPDGDPPGGPGGTRTLLKALKDLQALNRAYGSALDSGHANGAAQPNGTPAPNGPHTPPPAAQANRGKLRHGNPSGDFLAAPRCGARTRAGCACRQPAMGNGRCRLHGGRSTGAAPRPASPASAPTAWSTASAPPRSSTCAPPLPATPAPSRRCLAWRTRQTRNPSDPPHVQRAEDR